MFKTAIGLFLVCVALVTAGAGIATATTYSAPLSGLAETPPNASPGSGTATVSYDAATHPLQVVASFSGLTGPTTAAHIHCCVSPPGNAGVATTTPSFAGFPLGVDVGSFFSTLDLTQASSFNAAFIAANGGTVAGAEAALASGLASGTAYFNIHSTVFPAGEIRGFLEEIPRAVPSLSAHGLAVLATLLAMASAFALRRR